MGRGKHLESIDRKILSRIKAKGRGWVFTPSDFMDIGGRVAIDHALSRGARAGIIRRLAPGLYDIPEYNEKLGGKLAPVADKVAHAIARRTDSKIIPTGALAANLLGLSTQVPAKYIYLTNGPSRNIIAGRQSFIFRHASPRRMAAENQIASLVFEALRYMKSLTITPDMVAHLRRTLPGKAKSEIRRDLRHVPFWMRPHVEQIIAEKT